MKTPIYLLSLCLLMGSLTACSAANGQTTARKTELVSAMTPTLPNSTSAGFFVDSDATHTFPEEPQISRSRLVEINLYQLIDNNGQSVPVEEILLNLFPDVTYTGVIKQIEENGDGYSWVGYLKDVEFSSMTIVYTSGVFMGNFASPLGVYEFSYVEEDLYRIIMIDQTKFPAGEG
ncbi:MAG: hypothetical protein ABIJ65_02545 [Chloroflexota bacterium]